MGESASFLGNTVQAIGTILAVVCSFIAISKSRKEYASKEELSEIEERSDKRAIDNRALFNERCCELARQIEQLAHDRDSATSSLREEIRSLAASLSAALQDNARAIGRLEGSHDLAKQIAHAIQG